MLAPFRVFFLENGKHFGGAKCNEKGVSSLSGQPFCTEPSIFSKELKFMEYFSETWQKKALFCVEFSHRAFSHKNVVK